MPKLFVMIERYNQLHALATMAHCVASLGLLWFLYLRNSMRFNFFALNVPGFHGSATIRKRFTPQKLTQGFSYSVPETLQPWKYKPKNCKTCKSWKFDPTKVKECKNLRLTWMAWQPIVRALIDSAVRNQSVVDSWRYAYIHGQFLYI